METGPGQGTGRAFRDVLSTTVRDAAPREVPILEGIRDLDHHTALRQFSRPDHDGLGFGLPEVVATLTPALYIALDQALRKAVDLSVEGSARRLARKMFRRGPRPDPTVPPLTDEQIRSVCAEVLRQLEERGTSTELRDATAAALPRALPHGPGPADPAPSTGDASDATGA